MCTICGTSMRYTSSIPKRLGPSPTQYLKKYTIKESMQKIIQYFTKFPGYELGVGSHNNFTKIMNNCKNIQIHPHFYNALNSYKHRRRSTREGDHNWHSA